MKVMKFAGIQKTSLIDFPNRIASILFTPGCNLCCPYCYNWRLVLEPKGPFLSEENALQILKLRKNYVDAVVVTGGEPTLQKDLPQFLERLKEERFVVKLDTNGFLPAVLSECLPYVDYIALDVKTSLEKYALLGAQDTSSYLGALEILKEGKVDYEFRTTVVPSIVDEEDVPKICELVKGAKRMALQPFIPGDTLDKKFNQLQPYPNEKIAQFGKTLKGYVNEVVLRI